MSSDGSHIASPHELDSLIPLTITSSVIAAASLTAFPQVCTNPLSISLTVANESEPSTINPLPVPPQSFSTLPLDIDALPSTPPTTQIYVPEPLARAPPLTERAQHCLRSSARCTAEEKTFPAPLNQTQLLQSNPITRSVIRDSNYHTLSAIPPSSSTDTAAPAPLERTSPATQRALRYLRRETRRTTEKTIFLRPNNPNVYSKFIQSRRNV